MYGERLFYSRCIRSALAIISHTSRYRSTMAASRRVAVKNVEGDERLQMTLTFESDAGTSRVFTFDRMKNEDLGTTVNRISNNVNKFVNKKLTTKINKLKKKSPEEAAKLEEEITAIDVTVLHNGEVVDTSRTNDEAWIEGAVLRIAEESFNVELNIPAITSVKLPKVLVSGFPCYPRLDAEFIDLNCCEFTWYREKLNGAKSQTKVAKKEEWETLQSGHMYTPSNSDIGRKLKLVCVPKNGTKVGDEKEIVSKEVEAGPGLCPFENRQTFTTALTPKGEFRIVCYNILADVYADSEFSRTALFPYCPNYAMDFGYRRLLIVKELTGYNADIICLQECDRKFFMADLTFLLDRHGMNGSFLQKYGSATEGCAIFYRNEKFKFIEQTELNITESLMTDPTHTEIWQKVQTNEELAKHVADRSTCLQTVLLESKEDSSERVLVATTHLFFHPKADLIRILQTESIMKHLEQLLSKYESQGPRPSVIFCGDLNSSPQSAAVEYINTGMLPEDCRDYFDENQQRIVPPFSLRHTLQFTSACGVPECTNFTAGFVATLDHIFIDSAKLRTSQIVPMPTHEELSQFVALPSVVMPSDHIALVCDVAFKNKDAEK